MLTKSILQLDSCGLPYDSNLNLRLALWFQIIKDLDHYQTKESGETSAMWQAYGSCGGKVMGKVTLCVYSD